LSLARSHAAAGEHDVAADLAERILALHPRTPGAHMVLADARFAVGDDDGGLEALTRLADAFPDSGFARSEIARVHLERGAFAEAERNLREAVRLTPDLRDVSFQLALLAERRGDVGEAERAYRAELAAHPDHVGAWTNLGLLLASSDRIDAAADAFGRVIDLDPDGFAGYVLLARARMAQGAPRDDVVTLARRAANLAPDAPPVRGLLRDLGGLDR
jgi:tetratricopeptide (TPR) repeat protein